jgi:hypothetical protein
MVMNLQVLASLSLSGSWRILLELQKTITSLYTTFSSVLENKVSNGTGLQLQMQIFHLFLYSGLTFEYLHHSRKVSSV